CCIAAGGCCVAPGGAIATGGAGCASDGAAATSDSASESAASRDLLMFPLRPYRGPRRTYCDRRRRHNYLRPRGARTGYAQAAAEVATMKRIAPPLLAAAAAGCSSSKGPAAPPSPAVTAQALPRNVAAASPAQVIYTVAAPAGHAIVAVAE